MAGNSKDLKKSEAGGITRRQFFKISATGAVIAGTGTLMLPRYGAAQQKTLKILQWVHFVPGYDKWFNETYVKEWCEKNDTKVIVDNIGPAGINARAAAEVSAQKGHDLFLFSWPKPDMEEQVIDHREIYEHDQVEAMGMGDRIAVMSAGRVRQLGKPDEVYAEPADTFVAGFLGSPPMNLVGTQDRIVGFRPECFLPRQMYEGSSDVLSLPFEVNRIENLGADRLVYGRLGERFDHAAIIANLPTHFTNYTIETSQSYDFVVPRRDVKFFDVKTGLRAESIPL